MGIEFNGDYASIETELRLPFMRVDRDSAVLLASVGVPVFRFNQDSGKQESMSVHDVVESVLEGMDFWVIDVAKFCRVLEG